KRRARASGADRTSPAAGGASVSYRSQKAIMPRRSAAASHMLPWSRREDSPAVGSTACSGRGTRPREPGGGPTAGAPRPRTLPRGPLPVSATPHRDAEGRDAVGTAATTATHFVGIDVSKDTLDCCLRPPGGKAREATFGNDPRG